MSVLYTVPMTPFFIFLSGRSTQRASGDIVPSGGGVRGEYMQVMGHTYTQSVRRYVFVAVVVGGSVCKYARACLRFVRPDLALAGLSEARSSVKGGVRHDFCPVFWNK